MKHIITNNWKRRGDSCLETADILSHQLHPEGIDLRRVRLRGKDCYKTVFDCGVVVNILKGNVELKGREGKSLALVPGVHVYIPPQWGAEFRTLDTAEFLIAEVPSAKQSRGKKLLLRDEEFLSACATEAGFLRWILTPQYLSRRVFLYHDATLLSKQGLPLSWFRTTMFDIAGLPVNEEGRSVFKMSYNHRTEINVCYDVKGDFSVRMAVHPYQCSQQSWTSWVSLSGDSTYHLNEDKEHAEWLDGDLTPVRNKHEVHIEKGYVSLICLFDPAPTGRECHKTGEYSGYGDLSEVLGSCDYQNYLERLAPMEEMVDVLSMAKATGEKELEKTPMWDTFQKGRQAQKEAELVLYERLRSQGKGREQVLASWMVT